ncbi:alanine racemase [Stakelama marina]|uniref:alanine racemase n=1 Tax=Stakelama marina TaxID=2826939 RepID=A0A8T4IFP0_9SPHN|nr:alanine racemase [Stakelama marina]MBR0553393.1 alanine racemase [Stakelama marina]
MNVSAPMRLDLDGDALVRNWKALAALSGSAACGAAVKADGYGLGARAVVERLAAAGCRDFFVATWAEAEVLTDIGVSISVLHGVREDDMATATGAQSLRPTLNTPEQVRRWRSAGVGKCDVMVDTGMNRLGVSVEDVAGGLLDGLKVDTLMSHLACADDPGHLLNERQRSAFAGLAGKTDARRMSLANSAGIALGSGYAFDLTRPGLALYGGVPVAALEGRIAQVVTPHAQILQRRSVKAGGTIGYNATFTAPRDMEVAILNIGYADGYFRGFSDTGSAHADGRRLPVLGRVSMDLTAIGLDTAPHLREGDWVAIDFALPAAAAASGMSQYELLTGLGQRYERRWTAGSQSSG